ncbi:hypothetical protein BT69DRAFT_1382307 [Atractiella rhizophila]|nr:hypothetical protein BT69DRAFT_1382307 [Atractiella rhizophila]
MACFQISDLETRLGEIQLLSALGDHLLVCGPLFIELDASEIVKVLPSNWGSGSSCEDLNVYGADILHARLVGNSGFMITRGQGSIIESKAANQENLEKFEEDVAKIFSLLMRFHLEDLHTSKQLIKSALSRFKSIYKPTLQPEQKERLFSQCFIYVFFFDHVVHAHSGEAPILSTIEIEEYLSDLPFSPELLLDPLHFLSTDQSVPLQFAFLMNLLAMLRACALARHDCSKLAMKEVESVITQLVNIHKTVNDWRNQGSSLGNFVHRRSPGEEGILLSWIIERISCAAATESHQRFPSSLYLRRLASEMQELADQQAMDTVRWMLRTTTIKAHGRLESVVVSHLWQRTLLPFFDMMGTRYLAWLTYSKPEGREDVIQCSGSLMNKCRKGACMKEDWNRRIDDFDDEIQRLELQPRIYPFQLSLKF